MKQWANFGGFRARLGGRITPILSSSRLFSSSSSSSSSCLRRCPCSRFGGEEGRWSHCNHPIVMTIPAVRRWISATLASTGVMREGGEVVEEEVPLRSSRESRSALLRLLHDPQDAYLAVIADLDISSIVKVMKRGPVPVAVGTGGSVPGDHVQDDGKEKLEGEKKNHVVVDEKSSVQHVFDGLCAINAVLRMILEDPPSVEEVLANLDAAYEGFLWIYSHYPLRSLSLEALKTEWVVEDHEEGGAGSACTSSGSVGAGAGLQNGGDDTVNSSASSPPAPPQDHGEKAGEDKEKSEAAKHLSWNISKQKWESDFVPELKELHKMFCGVGERRKIHIA